MGWGWWGEKEALMNCSGRWLRKAISGTCVRLGSIWIVQWEGFCTFFVVTVWNFCVLQRENIVFWVIIIVQEKLLLGFVQRSRALQIITLNTEYVFFLKKSTLSGSSPGSHQRALPHCSPADSWGRTASFHVKYNRWCCMFAGDTPLTFHCGLSPGVSGKSQQLCQTSLRCLTYNCFSISVTWGKHFQLLLEVSSLLSQSTITNSTHFSRSKGNTPFDFNESWV